MKVRWSALCGFIIVEPSTKSFRWKFFYFRTVFYYLLFFSSIIVVVVGGVRCIKECLSGTLTENSLYCCASNVYATCTLTHTDTHTHTPTLQLPLAHAGYLLVEKCEQRGNAWFFKNKKTGLLKFIWKQLTLKNIKSVVFDRFRGFIIDGRWPRALKVTVPF